MSIPGPRPRPRPQVRVGSALSTERLRCGHTLVELTVVLVLFSVVMVAISGVLVGQRRFYLVQAQVAEQRDALRIAAAVLTGELRDVSSVGGDFYAIAADSVAFRSSRGYGVICGVSVKQLTLRLLTGSFGASRYDSALVFVENGSDTALDDEWRAVHVERVRRGEGRCPDGRAPDFKLVVSQEVAGATTGSLVRAFRPYVYKLYSGSDGSWWLGQRLRGRGIQPVAGPFASPDLGGLRFEYFDDSGARTIDPRAPVLVGVSLRGWSLGRVPSLADPDFYSDTLSVFVYLRNS